MPELLHWLLAAAGGLLALLVVMRGVVAWNYVHLALMPADAGLAPVPGDAGAQAVEGLAPVLAAMTPPQREAVDELAGLGFAPVAAWHETLFGREAATLLLARGEGRAFARLSLMPSLSHGYPVLYWSRAADGRDVATGTRFSWMGPQQPHALQAHDAAAGSLAEQWQAHAERLADPVPVTPATAAQRLIEARREEIQHFVAEGWWVRSARGLHPSWKCAWLLVRRLRAGRAALSRPFSNASLDGPHRASYLAELLQWQEDIAATRQATLVRRLALGVVTAALAFSLWRVQFAPRQAALLVGVLLVHEMGHVLAMRLLGWRELHLVMIPFLGAVAAGREPAEVAPWKQAVVLFAGPLPGLAAGLAMLAAGPAMAGWMDLAWIAVVVNAFNLLPVHPLDGGQLFDLAVFSRWPRARIGFQATSLLGLAALSWWLRSPMLAAATVLLLGVLRPQWRRARIESIARAGLQERPRGAAAAQAVCGMTPPLPPLARYAQALALSARLKVLPTGRAVSAAIVLALAGTWVLAARPLWPLLLRPGTVAQPSPEERAFAAAYYKASATPRDPLAWQDLRAQLQRLPEDDPRRRDVDWLETRRLDGPARTAAVEQWLAASRPGRRVQPPYVVRRELFDQLDMALDRPLPDRVAALEAVQRWAGVHGGQAADMRWSVALRVLEARDQAGGEAAVASELSRWLSLAECDVVCQAQVGQAQAWFHLSHHRAEAARQALDALARREAPGSEGAYALDRAWIELVEGDAAKGAALMREAVGGGPGHDTDAMLEGTELDLAVAESMAGGDRSAPRWLLDHALESCRDWAHPMRAGQAGTSGPWRQARDEVLSVRAMAWCPDPAAPVRR